MNQELHTQTHTVRGKTIMAAVALVAFVAGSLGGAMGGAVVSRAMNAQSNAQSGTQYTSTAAQLVVQEESDTAQVVRDSKTSVVSIVISKDVDRVQSRGYFYDYAQDDTTTDDAESVEICSGTGFVISTDGMILTNKHVICDENASYSVVFSDGTAHDAIVLAVDPLSDIAILKIEATDLVPLKLGDSSQLVQGQTVIAIGNALGEFQNTVTKGVVSGLDRDLGGNYNDLVQTDAAINEGNSGGPLINLAGEVVGVNTAIRRDSDAEGLGFAIPINEAKIAIESVKSEGRVVRPGLGVRYQPITKAFAENNSIPYEYGAYITGNGSTTVGVIPGGSADKAGLQDGDIILEVDGTRVDTTNPLASMIKARKIGEVLKLKVYQDGKENMVDVQLYEMPDLKK